MAVIIILILIFFLWYQFKVKPSRKGNIPVNEFDRTVINSEKIISHNVQKAKKFTEKKISLSYITSCNWILQNSDINIIYTFRLNEELLITTNGIVEKLKYEFIIDNNSLLITQSGITELYNIVNIENDLLYLNRISSGEILRFLNHTKIKDEVKETVQTNYYTRIKQENEIASLNKGKENN